MEKKFKKLIILIPAHNEEKTLKKILYKTKNIADTIVINDCSTDKTKTIAKKFSTYSINNKKNFGYDRSLIIGFKYILKKNYKYVLTFDADGEHRISDIHKLIKYIKSNEFNCVIGSRTVFNRNSERLLSQVSSFLFNISDPFSGFKCYKSSYLKKIIPALKFNKLYLGLFFFLNKNKIKNINIKVNKSKKSANYSNIKLEILFVYIFIKILFFK
tara:strand:- start:157 stop:801 length:645 start_codon:yes stop_codon:yes gene_type:complete